MPRLKLPGLPGEEHGRLVLVAQVAGFAVLIAGIAAFVMFAATSGNRAAPPDPAVPSITDAGAPAPVTTTEPDESLTPRPPVVQQPAAAQKPRPKPARPAPAAPRKPAPPAGTRPAPGPGDGGVGPRNPWESCDVEGAHAFSPRFHLPLVCVDGRWHFAQDGHGGPGRPGQHDGPGDGDGRWDGDGDRDGDGGR
jgi:hypothetical protein